VCSKEKERLDDLRALLLEEFSECGADSAAASMIRICAMM
jgi:hypothetical protein